MNNLINRKFGRLLVIEVCSDRNKWRDIIYKCLCDCGETTLVTGQRLKGGITQSCGCLQRERWKESRKSRTRLVVNANYKDLFSNYKSRSKKRNILFDLSYEDFLSFINNDCFYCGISPRQVLRPFIIKSQRLKGRKTTILNYNGIDRLDNNLGYTKENCVSCCKDCNRAKSDMSLDDFLILIRRISEKWNKKINNEIEKIG